VKSGLTSLLVSVKKTIVFLSRQGKWAVLAYFLTITVVILISAKTSSTSIMYKIFTQHLILKCVFARALVAIIHLPHWSTERPSPLDTLSPIKVCISIVLRYLKFEALLRPKREKDASIPAHWLVYRLIKHIISFILYHLHSKISDFVSTRYEYSKQISIRRYIRI
jgi:hypothetical protein